MSLEVFFSIVNMQRVPLIEIKTIHNFIDGIFWVMLRCFISREFFYVINLEIINNIGVLWGPSINLMYFLISWENFLYSRCSGWTSKEIKK